MGLIVPLKAAITGGDTNSLRLLFICHVSVWLVGKGKGPLYAFPKSEIACASESTGISFIQRGRFLTQGTLVEFTADTRQPTHAYPCLTRPHVSSWGLIIQNIFRFNFSIRSSLMTNVSTLLSTSFVSGKSHIAFH